MNINIEEEKKLKHLEFIQNVITRMNTNSFQIKGISITFTTGFITLFIGSNYLFLFFISSVVNILFWILDAYYLLQEKRYRNFYNDISGLNKNMNYASIRDFDMDVPKYNNKYSFIEVFWSKTIWPFYLIPLFAFEIVAMFLRGSCESLFRAVKN